MTYYKSWPGPIGLAWPQCWPGLVPIFALKSAPNKLWPDFKSWPGLKFGVLNNAWPHVFSQTDIFSVIMFGFID